jgi:hypothetical protein
MPKEPRHSTGVRSPRPYRNEQTSLQPRSQCLDRRSWTVPSQTVAATFGPRDIPPSTTPDWPVVLRQGLTLEAHRLPAIPTPRPQGVSLAVQAAPFSRRAGSPSALRPPPPLAEPLAKIREGSAPGAVPILGVLDRTRSRDRLVGVSLEASQRSAGCAVALISCSSIVPVRQASIHGQGAGSRIAAV